MMRPWPTRLPRNPATAHAILVLTDVHEVVRRRRMYLGAERDDPLLPLHVLRHAVDDALSEQLVGPVLHVDVVIASDHRFHVTDDGAGLPTEPRADGTPHAVAMFQELCVGRNPPRGIDLAVPTALCSAVTVSLRHLGRAYRLDSGYRRGTVLTDLGPAEGHGTAMEFVLDTAFVPEGLPADAADVSREFQPRRRGAYPRPRRPLYRRPPFGRCPRRHLLPG
ncbi:ATP-binding protein [Yinghuangia aomiensis]